MVWRLVVWGMSVDSAETAFFAADDQSQKNIIEQRDAFPITGNTCTDRIRYAHFSVLLADSTAGVGPGEVETVWAQTSL